jgi:predicted RNA-binding protein with PUA-like domain
MGAAVAAWLLKTEPGAYSYDDLERDGTTQWDGVTNAQAQLNLRAMRVGDTVILYHSQSDKAAVGVGRVVRAAYPDPTDAAGRRIWVDVGTVRRLERPVTLAELKADPLFATSPLLRQSRLSVVPLDDRQLGAIEERAATPVTSTSPSPTGRRGRRGRGA